jgi:hypothetical protein
MKRTSFYTLLTALMLLLCIATLSHAQTKAAEVTLAWDASDGAAGYKIYRGTKSGGPYTDVVDVGNVLTYKDKITARYILLGCHSYYDAARNESDFSNQVENVADFYTFECA